MKKIIKKCKSKIKETFHSCFIVVYKKKHLKKNIVFECESDMDDNPRALYEYLLSRGYNKKHKMIWIVNNVSLCKKLYNNKNVVFCTRKNQRFLDKLKLDKYLYTSKYFVFSHPYWFYKKKEEQIILHINHGVGFKGNRINEHLDDKTYDYILSPTNYLVKVVNKFWESPIDKIIVKEFPRTDFLFSGKKEDIFKRLIGHYKVGEKIIVAMPTYKKTEGHVDSSFVNQFLLSFIDSPNNLKEINDYLRGNDIHLIMKVHPLEDLSSINEIQLSNIHCYTNRDLLEKQIILYQMIGNSDALITDLSSVGYDYLVLNKPIGYLKPEIDSYDRGYLVDNVYDYMPGLIISSKNDFYKFVDDLVNNADSYREQRNKLLPLFHDNYMNNNSKLVCDWLLNL